MTPAEIIPAVLAGDKSNPIATLINRMNNFAEGVPSDDATCSAILRELIDLSKQNNNFQLHIFDYELKLMIAPGEHHHTKDKIVATFMSPHTHEIYGSISQPTTPQGLRDLIHYARIMIKDFDERGLCSCQRHLKLLTADYCVKCCLNFSIKEGIMRKCYSSSDTSDV